MPTCSPTILDHFVPTARKERPAISEDMKIQIRNAGLADLKYLLHHRRAMFEEMGFRDPAVLDRVENLSKQYFSEALRNGAYKAWLAQDVNGQIVGGGGIVLAPWPGFPGENLAQRAWILNMYTEPAARRHGVAKRLLEVMIDWCREKGFSAVFMQAPQGALCMNPSVSTQPTR